MHSYSSLPITTKGNTSVLQPIGAEMINKIIANWMDQKHPVRKYSYISTWSSAMV